MMYQPAKPAPTIVNAVRSCTNEKFCLHTSRHVQYDAKFELIGTPSMTLHASGWYIETFNWLIVDGKYWIPPTGS